MKEIKNVTIVGMGALGLLYGSMMASGGAQVHYVVDAERSIRYQNMEVTCNGEPFQFQLVKDTEAEPADLVLTAVKGTGLPSALNTMASCVGPETVIISVLNGISSEGILGERFGKEKMIHTVAQGMDAMKFGSKLQYTQTGNLYIGLAPGERAENLDAVKTFFDRTGVGYVEEADILRRMWSKFMLNVGVNQTCMVYGTTYGGVLADGEPNRTMISAMREVIALAGAEGILLNEQDLNQYIDIIGTLSPEGTPSMGQDRINRKPSEVELFAGTVIRLAEKHGLYVPVNRFLYESVQEIEKEYR